MLVVWFPLLQEILDNMNIAIICFPGCDVIIFEINLIFLIKSFSYKTKIQISWEREELLR